MSKIFVNQTKLTIHINVMEDISDVTTAKIRYIKPDRTRGEFTATIPPDTTGIVQYVVQNPTDLDQPGPWKLWAFLTYADGKTIPSDPVTIEVHPEGS
jgi:hypothetical protein